MEHREQTWERLKAYRRDLVELCEEINQEISYKRQVRHEWQQRTREWKEIWLSDRKVGNDSRVT